MHCALRALWTPAILCLQAIGQVNLLYEVLSAADALIRVAHDRDKQVQHHHGAQNIRQPPLLEGRSQLIR